MKAISAAQKLLGEVFEVTDRAWRGIGVIPKSGWRLNADYREFDAEERFQITGIHTQESPLCHSGDVLRGAIKPAECPAFGKECTPRHPLGATMVSSEGACAAYYNYGRFLSAEELAGAGSALTAERRMADDAEAGAPDFSNWSCPLPLADYPTIVMGHGGGGKLGNELVEHLFLPAFRNPALENLGDAAVLEAGGGRDWRMSTDSFVVQPLFFPGGSIGELAVNGTVNDLAVSGAEPKFLSASFILEEGFPLAQLAAIVDAMAKAAATAGVQIVTGDTKVVERGHGDGCYINTAGVGVLRAGIRGGPASRAAGRRGDCFGDHRRPRHGDHERARGPGVREPDPLRLRGAERDDCRGAGCGGRCGARHARSDARRAGLDAE